MKECPVCKESFQDDLNFCDLDGTPLDGGVAIAAGGSSSKLWSFLGVALLLAAVGITAGAILFFPRGPSANLPVGRSQAGTTAAGSVQHSTAPDAGQSQADAATGLERSAQVSPGVDATAGTTPDQTRLASRKSALSKNENSDPSLPNPKAVAGSDDDFSKTAKQPADENSRPRVSNPPTTGDSRPAAKVVSNDPSGTDSAATAAAAKRRSRPQSQSDDATAGGNRNDKKKGGFLRVFKKIFGHG
jgi:hypothetical protein